MPFQLYNIQPIETLYPTSWTLDVESCGFVDNVHPQYYPQWFYRWYKLNSVAHNMYYHQCAWKSSDWNGTKKQTNKQTNLFKTLWEGKYTSTFKEGIEWFVVESNIWH